MKCGRWLDRSITICEGRNQRRPHQMKKIMIVCLAALSFATISGCKKKSGFAEAMAKMTEFKDKMCACKDSACAQKVSDEMTKWSAEQAKGEKEPPKMSD